MSNLRCFAALIVLLAATLSLADSTTTHERTVTKLAEGIYEIRHPDAPDTFPQGNTTVIIGERGVFVVDSCLLPSSAREDIAQIKKWTDKPVMFLLNTHWHFDHTLGNATYAAAYPGIQIVAHAHTRQEIAEFNPGAVEHYPQRRERFKKILDSGKDQDGKPLSDADRRDYEQSLAGLDAVLAEFKDAKQLTPNVSYDHEMTVDLGNRELQIKFLGRANTAGDSVVYLPKEKIVITGDILDHPVPYMFGGFPADFPKTLRALRELDATTIIPGHGDVQHDKTYIDQVIAMMETANAEIRREIDQQKRLNEVQEQAPKALNEELLKQQFAGDDKDSRDFFEQSFAAMVKAAFNQLSAR
jgi:glyoxylase-like metal-dependent hydrolase (beta-lactamase superfamily II)